VSAANDKELSDVLAEEAEAAEAARGQDVDAPIPPHVKVSQPNRARSRVLQVRLNPEELAAVEQIAARRGLPASTVAREWLLAMINESADTDVTAQLAAAADRIKELVAQVVSRP
jgi:predicted DNA binding CopG/RHH family protein